MNDLLEKKFLSAVEKFDDRDYNRAGKLLEEIKFAQEFKKNEISFQANVNYLLARVKRIQGLFDQSYSLVQETLRDDSLPLEYKADGKHLLASLAFINGEINYAINFVKEELELAKELNSDRIKSSAFYYLGELHRFLGLFPKSQKYFKECYQFKDYLEETNPKLLSQVRNGLALTSRALGDYENAFLYLNEVLTADINAKRDQEVIIDYLNLFLLEYDLDKYEKLIELKNTIDSDLILKEQIISEGIIQLMNGLLSIKKEEFEIAQKELDLAIKTLEDFPFFELIISARLGIIESMFKSWQKNSSNISDLDKYKESLLSELNNALELCGQNRYWTLAINLLNILSLTYLFLDDTDMAFKTINQTKKLAKDWKLDNLNEDIIKTEHLLNEISKDNSKYQDQSLRHIRDYLFNVRKIRNL